MLISPKHRALVLNLSQPDRVLNVIPTAKPLDYKGCRLVVVPAGVNECKVLRNLGIKAPAPIRYFYDFPGRFDKPFHVQVETAALLSMYRRAFCLNDMGTGKTMANLWSADFLMMQPQRVINKGLIVAPLSALDRAWGDEIWSNIPRRKFAILHGTAAKRRKLLADKDFDFYIINHHGLEIIAEDLKHRPDINLVIIDELATYRNANTDIWKAANVVCNKQHDRIIWGNTGTPRPNDARDVWAQVRLVNPTMITPYFKRWRDSVMRQLGPYKWIELDNANDTIAKVMRPAVRFSRDDCIDLPPHIFIERHVELTAEQQKAYSSMVSSLKADIGEQRILAVNEAVKLAKLVQIACGVVRDEDEYYQLPVTPRIGVVIEAIEQSATKTIVYVPFRGALDLLHAELSKHFSVGMVDGRTSKAKRDKVFYEFQHLVHPQVLLAQPRVMSHALTLTAASTIVWYAPTTSNETFDQANHRIIRPSQKEKQLLVLIEGTPAERKLYRNLKERRSMQGALLEIMHDSSDFAG